MTAIAAPASTTVGSSGSVGFSLLSTTAPSGRKEMSLTQEQIRACIDRINAKHGKVIIAYPVELSSKIARLDCSWPARIELDLDDLILMAMKTAKYFWLSDKTEEVSLRINLRLLKWAKQHFTIVAVRGDDPDITDIEFYSDLPLLEPLMYPRSEAAVPAKKIAGKKQHRQRAVAFTL